MNIDSTNMRPADWLRIAEVIRENYDAHDGFVILHGTDTMSYTAAALSYLIQDSPKPIVLTGSQQPMGNPFTDAKINLYQSLGMRTHDGFVVLHGTDTMSYTAAALSYLIQDSPKPIVLTGSQQPMGNPFTDAKINLYQSLVYAVSDRSRDVSIVFGGYAIAGTRARKQRTMSFNAFNSINYPVLAYLRQDKIICSGSVAVSAGPAECDCTGGGAARAADGALDEPRFYTELNSRVCALKLTPGLTPDIFRLLKPDYDAVILETFGMGGVPERGADGASYQEAIFDWVDSGRTVVMTTQVPEEGLDLGVYEVGRAYAEHPGILKGGDMTTEALVAKTMWALGQTRDADELQRLFYRPINHDRVDEW